MTNKGFYAKVSSSRHSGGEGHIPNTPEGNLLCAVIERAILDLRGEGDATLQDMASARSFFLDPRSFCPQSIRDAVIKEFNLYDDIIKEVNKGL